MKIMHLSDLHLGKRLNQFSLMENQKDILKQILEISDSQNPDCVIIAGDVYDKSVPPAEAVSMFDWFISELAERKLPVMIISGNHDSPERIAFGAKIMKYQNIYLSPVYDGKISPVTLKDEFGEVNFYLLPFIKPFHVRNAFPDKKIESYTDAISSAVEEMHVNPSARNVLIAHQFVTGAVQSDSEEIYVGGLENVDAEAFSVFDYTALGHIHKPQNINKRIRYSGTPLKYSFSEANHKKSVTFVQLSQKENLPEISEVPLILKPDMKEIKGSFEELMQKSDEDYMHIILTNLEIIPDAVNKLRRKYPNLMTLEYENQRKATVADLKMHSGSEQKQPAELFADFFEQMNGFAMSQEQTELINNIIREIWEG